MLLAIVEKIKQDDKAAEIEVVFASIHDLLVQSAKPAERLKALLGSWNGQFRPHGQQRAGKAALAIILLRKQKGQQAVLI